MPGQAGGHGGQGGGSSCHSAPPAPDSPHSETGPRVPVARVISGAFHPFGALRLGCQREEGGPARPDHFSLRVTLIRAGARERWEPNTIFRRQARPTPFASPMQMSRFYLRLTGMSKWH